MQGVSLHTNSPTEYNLNRGQKWQVKAQLNL